MNHHPRSLTALPVALFTVAALVVACVGDRPATTTCTPKSCGEQAFACGTQSDGCGNAIECGNCEGGAACNAGKCMCVPKTCPDLGAQCGSVSDGCGGTLDCGKCSNAQDSCNATTHVCECKPATCGAQGVECGTIPDGCGGTSQCGTCQNNPNGPNCNAGKCTQAACVPKTCVGLGKNCGQVSDGCGAILDCGTCVGPNTCGGGGSANQCGCTPKTCQQLGKNCDNVGNGCGGVINCGTCGGFDTCGGTGIANVCGCKPFKCTKFDCGPTDDGCGGIMDCGVCTCFTGETSVLMADGSTRPIESLHHGDVIMGWDEASGRTSPRAVDALVAHPAGQSKAGVVVIDGSLRATPNHPFFVGGRSVRAGDLRVGDVLRTAVVDHGVVSTKDAPVKTVTYVEGAVSSYDVRTIPPSGYFVGPQHVMVMIKQPP